MKVRAKVKLLTGQLKFSNAMDFYVALCAGYAYGKSDAVFFRAMRLNVYRRKQGVKKPIICITAPSYRILKDSSVIDFEDYLVKFNIKYRYHKQDSKITLLGNNKGEFWFRSVDHPENIVGFEATDIIHDEFDVAAENKQIITLQKSSARLRGGNIPDPTQAFVSTPEGFKQLHKIFIEDRNGVIIKGRSYHNTFLRVEYVWNFIFRAYGANVPKQIPQDLVDCFTKYQDAWKGKRFDQAKVLKVLLIQCYDRYYEIHRSPLLEQYCGGEFVNVMGAKAYWNFEERHIIPYDPRYLIGMDEIWVGMDFNVNPMTAVFAIPITKINGDFSLCFFDEAWLENSNTYKMCEHIKERFPNKKIVVFPDMTGKAQKSSARFSDLEIITRAGFNYRGDANKYVRDSLNIVNIALMNNKITIMDKCEHLINDLRKVVRDSFGDIDKKEEKTKKLTHISDAFRYVVDRNFMEYVTLRGSKPHKGGRIWA